ncbi:thiamine diphosphokinase [Dethiosulfovibrio sp. F2B]|uniref:thiamine diphosphokinase n=1 Tax=Dethiosulfovibrio faecalis TaxID=2720018 RepID=UPI001F341E0B|nr:thiamine diphosphokinase [Dethiosulfovibrio faecalis]MCF4150502.1 thiamine diphosphokinase [Dethiosulfovibrio faecalis]
MRNISDDEGRNAVELPQVDLFLEGLHERRRGRVMVAGGRKPISSWLEDLCRERELWAVDSGADSCVKAGIVPDLCLGDFDSLSCCSLDWLQKKNVPLERHPADKDLTDFQLAVDRSRRDPSGYLIITGCWGGRFDHLWSLVMTAFETDISTHTPVILADHRELMFFLKEGESCTVSLKGKRLPKALSLLALSDKAEGVSVSGVKWPLSRASLRRETPYAVSNVPLPEVEEVPVSLEKGALGVYITWEDEGDFS